ncbi:Diacylglycerol kinase iota [Vitis vinifera]|uniref:Diacylglycerol kinase iota n=1 Tax=Vitis vinifera TaxID=29760 RepID=A0A438BPI0_VITVI|nr:Diacylglycerol kinase iota [Vitis vinifera]
MINPKDDANQGNDLLLSLRSIFWGPRLVSDISEVVPQLPLDLIRLYFRLRSDSEVVDRVRILVFGGDATTNRVLQAFCDMELHPTPPIGMMPLGTQVNISISLGWVIQ